MRTLTNETGQISNSLLEKSAQSPIEAIRSNPNQISGLIKLCGSEQIDLVILALLNEVFGLTNSPMVNMNSMAVLVRKNFWMLRVEEIVFALNKGINGGYGKIFGHLSYVTISEWLNLYIDTDRAQTVDSRNAEKQGEGKEALKADYSPDSPMAKLIEIFHTEKAEPKVKMKGYVPLTLENLDRNYLKDVMRRQDELSISDLYKIQELATESGYRFTCEHVGEEIEKREFEMRNQK